MTLDLMVSRYEMCYPEISRTMECTNCIKAYKIIVSAKKPP